MTKIFKQRVGLGKTGMVFYMLLQSIATPMVATANSPAVTKSAAVAKVAPSEPSYESLTTLLARDPKNATAYYLRGCLLMKSGNAAALKDFERASQLAPGTRIEAFSKLAISRLNPTAPKAAAEDSTDDSSANEKPKEEAPNQTVATIRKQAELAHARAVERGQIEAQEEVNKADNQAKAAQERLQRQAMESALGKYGGEQRFDPYSFVSPAQVDAFRAQAAATAERVRHLGTLKAGIKEQEGHEKANEIDYQAENLERQLKDDHPLSGIKLNPVGTNLYTRNYALVPPTVKPVRAKALPLPGVTVKTNTSLQFSSQNTSATLNQAPLSSQTIDGRGKVVKSSVKGQVLPFRQSQASH